MRRQRHSIRHRLVCDTPPATADQIEEDSKDSRSSGHAEGSLLVLFAHAPQLFPLGVADATLVPTSDIPSDNLLPSLLTTSDVLGTGWFAADAANVQPVHIAWFALTLVTIHGYM